MHEILTRSGAVIHIDLDDKSQTRMLEFVTNALGGVAVITPLDAP